MDERSRRTEARLEPIVIGAAHRCTCLPGLGRAARRHRAGRLTLPADAEPEAHASNAVMRHSRRGWRFDKPDRSSPIDAIVALCMAVERAELKPEPARLLAWL